MQVGREQMSYTVAAPKLQVAEATELLLDATCNARLNDWEVSDMLSHVQVSNLRSSGGRVHRQAGFVCRNPTCRTYIAFKHLEM